MRIIPVPSPASPPAIGPYNPAVLVSNPGQIAFISGQIGLDPTTGELVSGGLEAQVRCAMDNLKATLQAAGMELSNVCKTTLFLANMDDFHQVNDIYGAYFTGEPPARAAIAVAALPKGALFEVDAIAVKPSTAP